MLPEYYDPNALVQPLQHFFALALVLASLMSLAAVERAKARWRKALARRRAIEARLLASSAEAPLRAADRSENAAAEENEENADAARLVDRPTTSGSIGRSMNRRLSRLSGRLSGRGSANDDAAADEDPDPLYAPHGHALGLDSEDLFADDDEDEDALKSSGGRDESAERPNGMHSTVLGRSADEYDGGVELSSSSNVRGKAAQSRSKRNPSPDNSARLEPYRPVQRIASGLDGMPEIDIPGSPVPGALSPESSSSAEAVLTSGSESESRGRRKIEDSIGIAKNGIKKAAAPRGKPVAKKAVKTKPKGSVLSKAAGDIIPETTDATPLVTAPKKAAAPKKTPPPKVPPGE